MGTQYFGKCVERMEERPDISPSLGGGYVIARLRGK